MRTSDRYSYEVTYDVVDGSRDEYESWLSAATAQWITAETVCGFQCEHTVVGPGPSVRLRFEFDTLGDWNAFVTAESHHQCLDRLRTMTDNLTTVVWTPVTIPLSATSPSPQSAAYD
ncbi:hypothetical protein E6P09_00625 [Haloferax mediterranei ATCC 33500]|nr:hypothetical protein [Haloferax mediterranei]AFK19902.1 hypothetical protein HFX_2213 [Haloferax mediterranei ATCC 33500]AHZ23281.1 hypothetical protein BM92_11810 [Haloferax mediterranei ATCC 33500]MDX5987349.1 hypothetical protein [Haloferax mediterranei ATCC 33500]QCQ73860.1 hypothetical protein E6P09_00625 [Haloferax mediterranei ATCC 33500]